MSGHRHIPNPTATRLGVALAALVVLLGAVPTGAQQKPTEYAVKAAYLYNFGKFVKWPADSQAARGASFSICILGDDPFGASLQQTVAGETIAGKPAAVKRISRARDAAGCNILYIGPNQDRRVAEILAAVDKQSTLTVSDIPEFTDRGGMIGFVLESGRVRFQINLAAAQEARLTLSSELLKVAAEVKQR